VSDPLIARFADACGATGPLDLRVDLAEGGLLAEGSVDQPFTLVGRDDACDVTLSDPDVSMRHAWLQVLGGRVFAVDLGSHAGLVWPGGARGPGWLDAGTPVRIGPFLLSLRSPASPRPTPYPPGYNPLASDTAAKNRLAVSLEFRNGRRGRDRWSVNRLLTLIGRSPDCKIHLNAEDISSYHCGLVSTRGGLWVVDLSGRGVVVNGERMRVAPLPQGAELWVGRFLIGCQYQTPPAPTAPAAPLPKSPATPPVTPAAKGAKPAGGAAPNGKPAPLPVPGDARIAITPAPLQLPAASDDEVELGAEPEAGGLPASHIMADAFRHKGGSPSGSMSNPILVSGSGPKPPAPVPPGSALAGLLEGADAPPEVSLSALLRQMADLHGRAVAEYQQSQLLLTQLFARVKREHLAILQHELGRIQDLSAEIASLQGLLAKQSLERGAEERARQLSTQQAGEGARPGEWVNPHSKTPLPEPQPAPRVPEPTPAPRPADRLAALQQDRAARWQALLVLFAGM
jgi:pSer/pThr/pTyr-binding forkhead associated (FHA) protein